MIAGWTRTIATGATAARRWAATATAVWVWSLAGAFFLPWPFVLFAVAASAIQFGVLAQQATGRFGWWLAVIYPVSVTMLAVVVARSAWRFARRRDVSWKGRDVAAR